MNNKTIEILMFLLGYLKENSFDDESLSDFSENLVVNGYNENDVVEALGLLLEKLNYVPMDSTELSEQKTTSFRVLSDFERTRIPPDIFGYIMKLKSLSLISGFQMERILEFCMVNDMHHISEDDINELAAVMLFEEML
ncbi:MAG: DUF494 family protein [Candidatus Latescibacteria bacterium]|nr:DUF494 family protein [Candidatus Latescibacterota bacterium]